MIRAAIFDMDGLLIDSEPLWRQAEKATFAEVGLHLKEEDFLKTTGLRADEVVAYWFGRYPWNGPSPREVEARLVALVAGKVREGELKEGAREALAFVKRQAVKVALASSSAYAIIDAVLDGFGLRKAFEVVYSAQEEPYGKPHPGVYLEAARRLGVAPPECVALEDSLTGVIAAKAARMKGIAVPETPGPRFALADVVLGSLLELNDEVWKKFLNAT